MKVPTLFAQKASKLLILGCLLLLCSPLYGQTPNLDWAVAFSGAGGVEGRAIEVDAQGNVLIVGEFIGTQDFDPGSGTQNVTSAGFEDAYVVKLSPTGTFIWAKTFGSPSYEGANALAVDDSGNVYVGGRFQSTVDFDPGPGVVSLTSLGSFDGYLMKLTPAGDLVWVKQLAGAVGVSEVLDINLSRNEDEIYLTGFFTGTCDFDPGSDTLNFTSMGGEDIFVQKVSRNGDLRWARQMGSNSADVANGIAVDPAGNAITTGYFSNTADFDPGIPSFPLTSAGRVDIFISKLDSAGNFVWAKGMGGIDPDRGEDVVVDSLGNVYSVGNFEETVDFDPGPGTFSITANSPFRISDVYVSKLDAGGNFLFAKRMGGPGFEQAKAIALDESMNIYTTGQFSNTADFDPGSGTANLVSQGNYDIFVSKLDAQGNFRYAFDQGASSGTGDLGLGIASRFGCAYVTGYFKVSADFDPGPGTLTLTGGNTEVTFIQKVCDPACIPTAGSTAISGCAPVVSPGGNQMWTTSGMYLDTLTNAGGCDSILTVNLTVLSTSSSSITVQTCGSYTAPSGAIYSSSGTVLDTIPNAAGCDSVITINLTIGTNTTASLTETVCGSYTAPSGAVFTSSGTVLDTLPNASGCDSIITINLTVNIATTATLTENVCGSYTAPSGAAYTSSGTIQDTIPNAAGCDSVITINLTIGSQTNATLTENTCSSYTAPSGAVYTSSGTIQDTIPNTAGCDSIITINLTVGNPTTATLTETVCNSYTAPSGAVYTSSGTVVDTIPNTTGCDSIITINLTVNSTTTATLTETVCNSYTAPSGAVYSTSGTIQDTIPNGSGCDSIITINLTVNSTTTVTLTESVCNSYTAPSGAVYSTSGTIQDTIPNGSGCDSLITINLTVNSTTSATLTESVCNSYTAPSGATYTTSGTIQDTIPNTAGCDSLITINLTVNSNTTATLTESVCNSYTAPSGAVYTTSGTIQDTIPNTAGCDSLITINLTVNTVDNMVTQSGSTLTVAEANATYQWLDCDNNYSPLAGETNQSFTPATTGDYAVELTKGACLDTSACTFVMLSALESSLPNVEVKVYPNPGSGVFTLNMGTLVSGVQVTLTDLHGRNLWKEEFAKLESTEFVIDEVAGVYILTVVWAGRYERIRLVVW